LKTSDPWPTSFPPSNGVSHASFQGSNPQPLNAPLRGVCSSFVSLPLAPSTFRPHALIKPSPPSFSVDSEVATRLAHSAPHSHVPPVRAPFSLFTLREISVPHFHAFSEVPLPLLYARPCLPLKWFHRVVLNYGTQNFLLFLSPEKCFNNDWHFLCGFPSSGEAVSTWGGLPSSLERRPL